MEQSKQERLAALERQTKRLQARLDILNYRSNRYSWLRLGIFFGGIILSIITIIIARWLGLSIAVITIIAFSIAARYHRQIDRSIVRHNIWLRIKQTHIARIRRDWSNLPEVPPRDPGREHPFETDLDITGPRSLDRLMNVAVSYDGAERLRSWLLNTHPDLDTVRQRQTLVQELAPLSRFRDRFLLKSLFAVRYSSKQMEGNRLITWLNQPSEANPQQLTFVVATLLSALSIVALLLFAYGVLPAQYPVISILLAISWFFLRKKERGDMFEDADYLRDSFGKLAIIFEFLEKYPYGNHSHLKKMCEPFFANKSASPSFLLQKLTRLSSAAMLEKNQLAWVLVNAILPWDPYVALQLQRYKRQIAQSLPIWLDIWFELEALNSLATFAYLNPDFTIPQVSEPGQVALFDGTGLGHPLLDEDVKVVNDFRINEVGEIIMITGSNMAGKSTFLRTMGINLVLAYVGAPVNARAFSASLFRIYTCIKVSDSVTDGYSYFYAEVRRLKGLLTELDQKARYPLFFLIDEIFKGTNNRERLIGSSAYIRALVGKNCVGAISTHDLELVHLADSFPQIKNYHFREDVVNGQMVFDYILREGPCPTTNALKIMKMEGLPVE